MSQHRGKLTCQECKGYGEYTVETIDHWEVREHCGWCKGTGHISPVNRGAWLTMKREEKRIKEGNLVAAH